MSKKINYERVSLNITNGLVLDLLYEIKMYLERIHETCDIIDLYLECDGQIIKSYEALENYQTINFIISYYSENKNNGYAFYKSCCKGYSKNEVHVFGITNDDRFLFYTYNGNEITRLSFESLLNIDEKFKYFEANPMSVMFEIPMKENQQTMKALMKKWVEIGTEFFEECVDIEEYDGYVSYLVEPTYHMNRQQLTQMIELYNQLVEMVKKLNGRIISVQPLLVSHHLSSDLVIKIEKNNFGIWVSDPFFYPILN